MQKPCCASCNTCLDLSRFENSSSQTTLKSKLHCFHANQSTPETLSYCIALMFSLSHAHMHTCNVLFCFSQHYESVSSSFSFLRTFFLFSFFSLALFLQCRQISACGIILDDCVWFRLCTMCVCICVFVFTVLSLNFCSHYFLFYPVTL